MTQILVIDDDRHMRSVCMRALTETGWRALGAETGNVGLHQIRNADQKIDVVLLDQLMPGMSGSDALHQIHELDPSIPVIIITGFMTDELVLDLKKQGAFDCLVKPFTPEQLRAAARKALKLD